ncbi:hypothetical protein E6C27_scaffold175G001530 [Cucumis melo var. makuwa]|uniref:Uncharacterized protein n=1 Tax=Cucumis melo var. makuwa TaxID=1194695 RepID=A0A5A7U5M3_CUCMM|nr:hypothetical protein E6C27_scaffold175G001530 [Cucumis melo var. makuwa]
MLSLPKMGPRTFKQPLPISPACIARPILPQILKLTLLAQILIFETQSLDVAIFGEDPTEAHQLLLILPPIPKDLNRLVHSSPTPLTSTSSQTINVPHPPANSLNLQGLPQSLLHMDLVLWLFLLFPGQKNKRMASTASKRAKLQRELQNLHCSINYDKSATLAISEGDYGDQ